ncbi:HNH endonuclease [Tuwongella immobilis]|uniref:HNH endonuclease 5 domain-containing protein n=1 Tax=Tuwongella immobilis TaxID=692036 RepID=A0A6C2YWN4_9BACT|nr:HNH endonuclease [Tuwongella immobilis]VIP05329.1 hnh endonuclease : Uncharacterized protein OS=Beggiatoa sp. SS GN=BGS_0624 PE=4 SV=1: HNH [Tuwongella immobilis]VTS08014.1 hnh endonuclease : Uncharacterized protein OS=Beggiatoa sp. SS GN=BGS_0624 PE=4 SV=1: HNH [Tuwongella immobilis]
MPKKDMTAGEVLCTYLKRNILDEGIWPNLTVALSSTGRGEQWVEFVEEVVATQLTGRLVTAGKSIAENLGGLATVGGLQFKQQLYDITTETMLASLEKTAKSKLTNLVERAVLATYGNVSDADKKILRGEVGRNPRCYLCNQMLEMRLDTEPSDEHRKRAVEYEHVWPRAFGGNTEIENLALSCHDCNQRKANFANWAMVDIQSLVLGFNPSGNALEKIPGLRRFAMLSYAAHRMASKESLSLKAAHLRLQNRVAVPRVQRTADVADFFNLLGHTESN